MVSARVSPYLIAAALVASPAMAQTPSSSTPGTSQGTPATGAQHTAPAAAASANAAGTSKLSASEFVKQAAMSDMFEIQSSQAVMNKTQDQKVRDFAQHMVRDHTAADNKLKAAAKGQNVPTSLDQEHTDKLKQLQQANGGDVTATYVNMQVAGHRQAVQMFENYAQNGDDAALKQYAQQTLPTLREHLQEITQLQASNAGQPNTAANTTATTTGRTAQNAAAGAPGTMPNSTFISHQMPNAWRASKLVGVNVYNENNDKIGDINEVMVDKDGKVDAVVIGVGGFLGIGEHNVAVPFDSLRWSDRSVSATRATTATTTAPAATAAPGTATTTHGTAATSAVPPAGTANNAAIGSGTPATTGAMYSNRPYPDHAVLPNASKDQLKAAPAFNYGG